MNEALRLFFLGDEVMVLYNGGTDSTPLYEDGDKSLLFSGFSGYRIANWEICKFE